MFISISKHFIEMEVEVLLFFSYLLSLDCWVKTIFDKLSWKSCGLSAFSIFQIAPVDLESVLMSHPDILDAAVTA